MNEIEFAFKEYIDAFKAMEKVDKRKEIIRNINEITAIFNMIANESNMQLSQLKSNEFLNLEEEFETEDAYLEALLVCIENAKSVIGEYLVNIVGE